MPVTLTLTTDLDRMRVGVQASGILTATLVTVERVHADGSTYPVRTLDRVTPSGGVVFGWDYEVPLAQTVSYRAVVAAGAEVIRVNRSTRPSPLAAAAPWQWQNGTGGAGASSYLTTEPRPFVRRTISTADTGGNSGWFVQEDDVYPAGQAGQTITASVWLRTTPPVGQPTVPRRLSVVPRRLGAAQTVTNSTGSVVGGTPGATITPLSGVWQRWSWQVTTTGLWDGFQVWCVESTAGPVAGTTVDARDILVEISPTLGDYFDGSTPDTLLLQHDWADEIGASVSLQRGLPGVVIGTSSPVRLSTRQVWLRAPGQPGVDVGDVDLVGRREDRSWSRPATVHWPVGASNPVVITGAQRSPEGWKVRVRGNTVEQSRRIEALVRAAPVILVCNPGDPHTEWEYAVVTNAAPVSTRWRDPSYDPTVGVATGVEAAWSRTVWELTCTTVARPAGGSQGDPSASWEAFRDAHASWDEARVVYDSWLDAARGVQT